MALGSGGTSWGQRQGVFHGGCHHATGKRQNWGMNLGVAVRRWVLRRGLRSPVGSVYVASRVALFTCAARALLPAWFRSPRAGAAAYSRTASQINSASRVLSRTIGKRLGAQRAAPPPRRGHGSAVKRAHGHGEARGPSVHGSRGVEAALGRATCTSVVAHGKLERHRSHREERARRARRTRMRTRSPSRL